MAKATSQSRMNALHDKVASVFLAVLKRYELRLDKLEVLDREGVEDEMLRELFDDGALPSPAMLSAVTKFLKDNEVLFEKDVLDEISSTQRSLEERRKNRPTLASLTLVPNEATG